MSELDVPYGEASFFSEDVSLVVSADKPKHAAKTEKVDAKLLSDGSSEDENEDDLVLEYTDGRRVSGSLQDSVDYEEGASTTASDTEISAPSSDNIVYTDSSLVSSKLVSFESENNTESPQSTQNQEEVPREAEIHNDKISEIAEALHSVQISNEKEESSAVHESDKAAVPGVPILVNSGPENDGGSESQDATHKEERRNSGHSLTDSENADLKQPDCPSSEHSLNDELEWEEEYRLDEIVYHERNVSPKATLLMNNMKQGNKKAKADMSYTQEIKETSLMEKETSLTGKGTTLMGKETSLAGKETILTGDSPSDTQMAGQSNRETIKPVLIHGAEVSPVDSSVESKKLFTPDRNGTEPGQKSLDYQKQTKNRNAKPASSGLRRKKHKLRHKIYLDDPDIHQRISDFSNLLKKFRSKAGNEKFVPTEQNRLHPVSRDDVFEVKTKKKGSKKRYTAPSALKLMDQPSDENMITPRSQSAGQLGPYDGHGKRGRNFIARIKGCPESSASSQDEDEITNDRVSLDQRDGSTNGQTAVCSECGEQHSFDEDSEEDSEQEICPDCGVPHNPFQHPPSPSAKNKWRQYVEHCRKAMLQISSKNYQQVPQQDQPEHPKEEDLPSIEGPHTSEELSVGARYKMKYLGTTQVVTQHPVTKETRMQQAQEAYYRIKVPEGEAQPCTETEMIISLERLKVVNCEGKHDDVMMDHALRTVCFICDIGNIMVLMSRRLTTDLPDLKIEDGSSLSLANIMAEKEKRTSKNICHIFECEEAQLVSKAIGQAFNMAYRQFLRSNGISHDNVEEAEYCHVLESQKIVGQDLDLLTDRSNSRDVVIQKKRHEPLGLMLLESGWGSMLPTVFIAHIANYSPAARLGGQISVGDHVLACNGASLVGIPLSECNTLLRNTRSSARVILKLVACPPVVDVVVSRPDTKYQLGFSVQNGTICSLLRGGIAERGGVRVGHRIIEINGQSVVAKSHQHIVDILAHTSGEISMKTLPVAMYRLMVGVDTPSHI